MYRYFLFTLIHILVTFRIEMASKNPEDDPMEGKEKCEFKTILEIKEVLDMYANWNYPKRGKFIQKLIEDSGLSLSIPNNDQTEKEFLRLKDLVGGRWDRLHKNFKDANYSWVNFKKDPNDVFIDLLIDFPNIVKYEAIKPIGSQASTSSARSWLEQETPARKMRKDFDDMVPRSKRRLTEPIYDAIHEAAEDINIEPEDLLLYLGSRMTYLKNKKMSNAFESIKDGSYINKQQFPIEKAASIKTQLWLSSREWTELRIVLDPYVRLPTKDEIRFYRETFQPKEIPFHFGLSIEVPELVLKTLERLPKELTDKLPNEVVGTWNMGFDASGTHRVYNSATSLAEGVDTSHFIVSGASLVNLKQNDSENTILYEVPYATSPDNVRPLVRIKPSTYMYVTLFEILVVTVFVLFAGYLSWQRGQGIVQKNP